ncbi:MAG: class I SAM-dependent methyltransferase [Acutalibacter sp.]|nr:class I SAM-dependent methyltransferase [Acutalibacter sp.]
MLSSKGFDLWANGYDKSVGLSDEDGTYPFAGYRDILNEIYNRVLSLPGKTVLDIGFGTGTLTAKLYEQGCHIFGQDFSPEMLRLAQEKIPEAHLYLGDFSQGLAEELKQNRYDAVIATYSLHHLTDPQKVDFLKELWPLLNEGGCICIGDVAFQTRRELEQCKAQVGDGWDSDEIYFVFDELKEAFPQMEFQQISHCAGLLTLEKSI